MPRPKKLSNDGTQPSVTEPCEDASDLEWHGSDRKQQLPVDTNTEVRPLVNPEGDFGVVTSPGAQNVR